MGNRSRCRLCSAPIIWAKTVNNKSIPLDPDVVMGGNIAYVNNIARVMKKEDVDPMKTAYQAHMASCTEWGKK